MAKETVDSLVAELKEFKPGKPLLNYITHVRFPNFKGLERGMKIDFPFPLTALVGANGIGKSSVLHALYGMPEGQSTAKFWFSTELDPIKSKASDPPRYIYGHWHYHYKGIVETRKARVFSKSRGYEYWEPTKATKGDEMEDIPAKNYPRKDADRWNAVIRDVLYLNMKVVIGAFDRTYHFGAESDKLTAKHAELQSGAKKLKSILDRDASSWHLGGGRERVFENRQLTNEELTNASRILGRHYESAQYIRHSLYPGQLSRDTSVIFNRGFKYSEAFAGSGEVAVVNLVVELLQAPKYSLILLDEPETSLHPGAQRELLLFLLSQIKKKHLQVVLSTHSSEFLDGLPPNAIKVFEDNGVGASRVINECSAYVAFNRLGKQLPNRKRIYVEDRLAEAVVRRAIVGLDPGECDALEVVVAQGGAATILSKQVPTHIVSNTDCYVLLDGDQKRVEEFIDQNSLAPDQHSDLEQIIMDQVGCRPVFALNGGDDAAGNVQFKIQKQLEYLSWIKERLAYLPYLCPEAFILGEKEAAACKTSEEYKNKLKKKLGEKLSPDEFIGAAKYLLNELPDKHEGLTLVRLVLKKWLAA